ncbi:MAG: hypothetical protein QW632_04070 [Ignisphaera sp.]
MAFLKDVLTRIRRKSTSEISKEEALAAYAILLGVRKEMVDSFYNIANRRLRELYDSFSMTMLKLDKIIQTLRRMLGDSITVDGEKLGRGNFDEYLQKLSLEASMAFRSLIQNTKLLKEFSQSSPPQYLKAMLKGVDDAIDKVINVLENL